MYEKVSVMTEAMVYSLLFLGIGYANGMDVLETKTLLTHLVTANIVGMLFSFAFFVFERGMEHFNTNNRSLYHFTRNILTDCNLDWLGSKSPCSDSYLHG